MRALLLAALTLMAAGCPDAVGTQYLPIGSRCSGDACGTKPFSCNTTYPGGYCQKDCASNGECPADALCALGQCRRLCTSDDQCRKTEGYVCREGGATAPVCETSPSAARD